MLSPRKTTVSPDSKSAFPTRTDSGGWDEAGSEKISSKAARKGERVFIVASIKIAEWAAEGGLCGTNPRGHHYRSNGDAAPSRGTHARGESVRNGTPETSLQPALPRFRPRH